MALERERQRLSKDVIRPVEIRTPDDIKRVIGELDPRRNRASAEVVLSTLLDVTEGAERVTYRVSAPTRSKSKRDILLEGLAPIKARMEMIDRLRRGGTPIEVSGVSMFPAQIGDGVTGRCWVDPLIRQWLGAYRDGIHICWDLGDGYIYRYDIWNHRLVRIRHCTATSVGSQ